MGLDEQLKSLDNVGPMDQAAKDKLEELIGHKAIVEDELLALETEELIRRACFWSVDVPNDGYRNGFGDWILPLNTRNALRRAIKDEARKELRFWGEFIVPILSLLVALAAIMAN